MVDPLRNVTNMQEDIPFRVCQAALELSNGNDSGLYEIGGEIMDDSLTDMQWLQKMDASAEIPGMKGGGQSRKRRPHVTSCDHGTLVKDSCRKKLDYCNVKKGTSNKPPLSYASLIALAICSTPQRMLTLSGIYKWIENTFPFYRTPEAKAWKNSIRHNLSIRKGMFMKVYQYPPRRGNGSYWTLLSEGEDELKRAIPLFSTFQPPVIDPESAYNRAPTTHTVKSRGQFVPVLPRAGRSASTLPYFSVGSSTSLGINQIPQQEIAVLRSSEDIVDSIVPEQKFSGKVGHIPVHLLDHSYAKQKCQNSTTEKAVAFEPTIETPMTPKRRKLIETPPKRHSGQLKPHHSLKSSACSSNSSHATSFAVTTPSSDHDISLSFLDSSLLTPLKDIVNDIEIGGPQGISLSPLYANFISPRYETPSRPPPPRNLTSPSTPHRGLSIDSGVFTPFQPSDTLDSLDSLSMKCSTPLKLLSPISNILPSHTFNTPHQDLFPEVKLLDSSTDSPEPSIRLGSLQALGLPGLTPPSSIYR